MRFIRLENIQNIIIYIVSHQPWKKSIIKITEHRNRSLFLYTSIRFYFGWFSLVSTCLELFFVSTFIGNTHYVDHVMLEIVFLTFFNVSEVADETTSIIQTSCRVYSTARHPNCAARRHIVGSYRLRTTTITVKIIIIIVVINYNNNSTFRPWTCYLVRVRNTR